MAVSCSAEINEARYGLVVGWRRLAEYDDDESLHGGGRGLSIIRTTGGKETVGLASGLALEPGDTVRFSTANRGRWRRRAGST